MKREPKWKRFEALVARVQHSMSPDAAVTLNEKILGRRSGTKRQIDISVRRNIGQFDILIVMDCKDYNHPADVKDVEEFIGLVEDVGANKGALVAANGFTEAARTRAKNAGVDLYRLVDAEEHNWRTYVTIPIVCDFRSLGPGRFTIGGSPKVLQELSSQDPRRIPLFDNNGAQIGNPLTLLWAKWNKREIPDEPGSCVGLGLSDDPLFVHTQEGGYEQVEFAAHVDVVQKLYYGQLPLTKIAGFKDEISGDLMLPGNTEIITADIVPIDVERTWPQIASLEALAVKPVFVLRALDHYPSTIPVDYSG